jgi:hypothetical protein
MAASEQQLHQIGQLRAAAAAVVAAAAAARGGGRAEVGGRVLFIVSSVVRHALGRHHLHVLLGPARRLGHGDDVRSQHRDGRVDGELDGGELTS